MLIRVGNLREPEGLDPETYWKGPLEVQWSLHFPVGEEPKPEVVRAIRTFYPRYVPLWVTRVHLSPDGRTKVPFGYHVIGRWRESPDDDFPDLWRIVRVDRPPDFPFKGGVIYEQRTVSKPWPDHSPERYIYTPDRALPGPTHMEFARWMEEMYKDARGSLESLRSKLVQKERAKRDRDERDFQKLDEEKQYELMSWRTLWNKAIDEGRIFDEPREPETKPYAFMGLGAS